MDPQAFVDSVIAKIDEIYESLPDDLNREGERTRRFRLIRDFLTQYVYAVNHVYSSLTGYDCGSAAGFYDGLKYRVMSVPATTLNPSLINECIAYYDLHYASTLGPLN
jgi:hypothetical protein